jgi:hypothetical protein
MNFALVLAFVQAPFLHIHLHESTAKHSGAFFHSHFAHVAAIHPTQSELRDLDPNDDAQFQSWFSVTTSDSGFTPVILSSFFSVLTPQIANWLPGTIEPSSHGPPLLNAAAPRAPPA